MGSLSGIPFSDAKVENDKALVYIYRPEAQGNSLNPDIPFFYMNEKRIGPLRMSGYYFESANPGPVEVYFTYNGLLGSSLFQITQKFYMSVEAGKTYFIALKAAGMLGKEYTLKLMPNAIGEQQIKGMELMRPTLFK